MTSDLAYERRALILGLLLSLMAPALIALFAA